MLLSSHFLRMATNTPLGFHLRDTMLKIVLIPIAPAHARHKERRIRKEIVHLLERTLSSLGLEGP